MKAIRKASEIERVTRSAGKLVIEWGRFLDLSNCYNSFRGQVNFVFLL
ncbi:hypothetical protein BCF46_2751 [Litoreibacter meonggei]|uniref:Uncharacterized protein n=1 Tax=Litoreibacter meonggei TaxID=1049199 RepID=A0A497VDU0_9RHOB|nr:hypothetical protein BCF46_2751 [Litoreibacter meonggei]